MGDGNRTLAKLKTNNLMRVRVTPNAPIEQIWAVFVPESYPDSPNELAATAIAVSRKLRRAEE